MVQKASGKFEVAEGNTSIVSGVVRIPTDVSHEMLSLEPPNPHINDEVLELSSRDIYKELQLRGYDYQGLFRGLVCADNYGR
jgi:fatty acid synthase